MEISALATTLRFAFDALTPANPMIHAKLAKPVAISALMLLLKVVESTSATAKLLGGLKKLVESHASPAPTLVLWVIHALPEASDLVTSASSLLALAAFTNAFVMLLGGSLLFKRKHVSFARISARWEILAALRATSTTCACRSRAHLPVIPVESVELTHACATKLVSLPLLTRSLAEAATILAKVTPA
jgi:hypothetical protein